MRINLLAIVSTLLFTFGAGWSRDASAVTTLYWTTAGGCGSEISRSNSLFSTVIPIITSGHSSLRGVAVDSSADKMYWTDAGLAWIRRANTDGTGVEDLITAGLSHPSGIALDVANGKMYWTDLILDRIQRAELDGTNVETLVSTGLSYPFGISLDLGNGKMYWTDANTLKIQRANLDGTSVEDLITTGLSSLREIGLDAANGKMYWAERTDATGKIRRANLDGSGEEDLVTNLDRPQGLAVDSNSGHVYWSMAESPQIRRAELDGTNPESLLADCQIEGIALGDVPDPAPATASAVPALGRVGTGVSCGVLGAIGMLYGRSRRQVAGR